MTSITRRGKISNYRRQHPLTIRHSIYLRLQLYIKLFDRRTLMIHRIYHDRIYVLQVCSTCDMCKITPHFKRERSIYRLQYERNISARLINYRIRRLLNTYKCHHTSYRRRRCNLAWFRMVYEALSALFAFLPFCFFAFGHCLRLGSDALQSSE